MIVKKIFLDIESLPPEIDIEEFKLTLEAPKTHKKPEKIQEWIEDNWEEKYKKMAVDTNKANICSLSAAVDFESPIVFLSEKRDEKKLLEDFYDFLIESINQDLEEDFEVDISQDFIVWIGFNNKKFDMDLLWKRALHHGLYDLCKLIPRDRYTRNIIDLMEFWSPFEYNKYFSQDEMCNFLNIEGKPDGIDGSKIYDFWMEKRFDEIADYNIDDVVKLQNLYKIVSKATNLLQ